MGLWAVHVLIQFVIFMTKQKESLGVNYYLPLKYCKKQCTLLSPTWAKSLTKFNPKCQILKMFWCELVSKRKIKQLTFSIRF